MEYTSSSTKLLLIDRSYSQSRWAAVSKEPFSDSVAFFTRDIWWIFQTDALILRDSTLLMPIVAYPSLLQFPVIKPQVQSAFCHSDSGHR